MTSGENSAIIAKLLEAYVGGRTEEALRHLDEDVVFYADPNWPEQGPYRGPETIAAQFDQWEEVFGPDWRSSFTTERMEELPDGRVLVENKLTAAGATSGVPFEQEFASVYTLRDGLVVEASLFLSWAKAREAAQSPPP